MWWVYAILLLLYPIQEATVTRVIDGDTIDTSLGRVRLLNVNTPEKGQRCYGEAKQFLMDRLGKVQLERDFVNKDKYGRLLRYVHSNGLVELELVKKGLAKSYCLFPDLKYCKEIVDAQVKAMNSGGCLWENSNNSCLKISDVSRAGNWVKIKNKCGRVVGLDGVYVESDGRQREYFRGDICQGCTETKSLRMGKFAMLFNDNGFIDYRASQTGS